MKLDKVVLDTSVLIDGYLTESLLNNKISVDVVIIPVPAIDELQAQANKRYEKGFLGLREIQRIRELSKQYNYKVLIYGEKPNLEQIKLAKSGYIDYLILKVAISNNATLLTSDKVLYEVAKAYSAPVIYIEKENISVDKPPFLDLFTEDTMSVHIIEGVKVKRKRGKPGEWYLEEVDKIYNKEEIEDLIDQILYISRNRFDSFIEQEREDSIIIQLSSFRIVIVKPPLSDSYEITIVRPVKILKIQDYNLDEKILGRLRDKAEGIIIVGRPGSGKTTFAQALSEYYLEIKKIVKTIEAPRDLNLSKDIIQYSKKSSDKNEIHDILLLSRPDYVIFDEMRNTDDFNLYIDLRLAGIGMIGVSHAERPIDIIHRLLSRTELGLIPQVIDTIIFIDKGTISKIYYLNMVVKIPTGLKEEDLTRPVVEIRDFMTDKLEYEIYTFGDEIIVSPVNKKSSKSGLQRYLEDILNYEYKRKYQNIMIDVGDDKIIFYIQKKLKGRFIRMEKPVLMSIKNKYKLRIEIKPIEMVQDNINIDYEIDDNYIIIRLGNYFKKKDVGIYIEGNLLGRFKVNKRGKIVINKKDEIGKYLENAINSNKKIEIKLI
ncbi:ATPase [Nanobdella aerobiophila]|uniref:ATPase n=1 Tax=Nanobdella aerobiophila TaxID=2586965 RepID=A0A915SXN5_9ARCH|nr:ATPase, T2SS/T4P/T4SS family [Nanobdella aerobiophila]BBL45185.1 ATPase [Nanobdella aerobiophila]